MRFPFCKCPFCEYDLLLESKVFQGVKDALPKTRYLQAYVKYLKIRKLAKEYKNQLSASMRIRDLIKDCLNDMEMAIETKYGKEFKMRWSVTPPNSPCYSCPDGTFNFGAKVDFLEEERNKQVLGFLDARVG